MFDKEKLKHFAYLAKITLTEEELIKFSNQLQKILAYVEKINELNLEELEPLISLSPALPLREDLPEESQNTREIINNFPEKKDDYLVVPKIL